MLKLIAYGEKMECTHVEKGPDYIRVYQGKQLIREDSGVADFSGYRLIDENGISVPWIGLEELRENKLKEIGKMCTAAIQKGVTLEFGGEPYSFSYTQEDQLNISELKAAVLSDALGIPSDFDLSCGVPYHANGKPGSLWSKEDFMAIVTALSRNKLYNLTLCNHLNIWIRRETDYHTLESITYQSDLPKDLSAALQKMLAAGENTAK